MDDATLPHAHHAAAVALSNPLRRPALTLEGLDPALIARRAWHLGTAPAVIAHLSALGHGPCLSDHDQGTWMATLARNMVALELGDQAAATLEALGLRVAPLKGYGFLLDFYGQDVGRRRMFDVDLLVEAPQLLDAADALEAVGWTRRRSPPVSSRLNIETVMTHRQGDFEVTLELHRALCWPGRFRIDTAGLWRRALPKGPRAPGWRLDPVDQLLHLALHKAQHGWLNDCRDMVDATNLQARHRPDPGLLIERARRWGCAAVTWLFLARCRRAFGLAVDDATLTALRPPAVRRELLERHLPDPTVRLDFYQRRNNRRDTPGKVAVALLSSDLPWSEAAALGAVALRALADRAADALRLPDAALDPLARVPLGPPRHAHTHPKAK